MIFNEADIEIITRALEDWMAMSKAEIRKLKRDDRYTHARELSARAGAMRELLDRIASRDPHDGMKLPGALQPPEPIIPQAGPKK